MTDEEKKFLRPLIAKLIDDMVERRHIDRSVDSFAEAWQAMMRVAISQNKPKKKGA